MTGIQFRVHALQRMFTRGISVEQVRRVIEAGETIEDYSAEMPEPGKLLFGLSGKLPIHVVVSEESASGQTTVVTVYVADPERWRDNFRSRKP
ncbi:MAG TPA: DUF4258 domain-containing protein [Anaerolineales bacterium]|jgi:hypothetical protein